MNAALNPHEEKYVSDLRGKGKLVPFRRKKLIVEIGEAVKIAYPCADWRIDALLHLQSGIPGIFNEGIIGGPLIFAPSYLGFNRPGALFKIARAQRVIPDGARVAVLSIAHWPCHDALGYNYRIEDVIEQFMPESADNLLKLYGPNCTVFQFFHEQAQREGKIVQHTYRLIG